MDSPALPVASCAVILSSGGIDSTTCLALAVKRFGAENVTALGVSYGQKHVRELESAQAVAKHYQVAQHMLDLSNALAASTNALMARSSHPIEHESYGQQIQGREEGPVSTYVPLRNGLMLSAAAAFALSIYPDRRVLLYLGAHADDAAGSAYPDCSAEFVGTMGRAIELGTYGLVSLEAPFVHVNKAAVVKCGLDMQVPYHLTWSCYEGSSKPCGTCGTCIDRIAAFRANGIDDPLEYA